MLDSGEIDIAKKSMSSYASGYSLWLHLKLEALKCSKKSGLVYESPEEGDYYIAVDLAGFEDVNNKKRTKNTKLDDTAIAVAKVNENGWFVEHYLRSLGLDETATKIFRRP